MATKSTALVLSVTEKEESNGWEALVPLLHPTIADAPREGRSGWKRLERRVIRYLTHTVAKFPWLNHLALAAGSSPKVGSVIR